MEYAYATCLLNESDEEINETNLVAVLDAAGCPVQESRVKAIVAALEDVDVDGVTGVDFDEISSDPRHDGATGSASGSELTAIETDPDSASRADDTRKAIADATDEDSTGDEFEVSGSPTPDDEV